MTMKEKATMLDSAIRRLYVDECRSISYIHRLLGIDRHTISRHIQEHDYHQFNQHEKKIRKFLKSYKERIISMMKEGYTNKEIYNEFGVGRLFFTEIIEYDKDIQEVKKLSCKGEVGEFLEIEGEEWKPIEGYPNYEASTMGRVRTKYGIVKPTPNSRTNRYYISMVDGNGKRHNLILARVIAGTFCEGHTKDADTVNHKDGDTHNNKVENLEWVSQADNNRHAFRYLKRKVVKAKPLDFLIRYKGKYVFKTITAFARFIEKSPTQAARWIYENPEEHEIEKISKEHCNDYPKGVGGGPRNVLDPGTKRGSRNSLADRRGRKPSVGGV